ncbi:MAG: glycosyltransferase family 2 protein [Candidatus Omnitrophica bacterium]|nr:glycosyltransferase family 2 protein [Candidatus Omnitrophota bacterium]
MIMKVCVLLPAYNEERAIGKLINQIRAYGLDVVVVDDGSTDHSAAIARQAQAIVISHQDNKGKGQALRTGFKFIQDNNYDAVVIMDSDGQHLPQEINNFINHALHSNADIIIGNRMGHPQGMSLPRRLTNKFTSLLISLIAKTKIPDSQCGFRLIRCPVLEKLNLLTVKYDTESEILIQAAKYKYKIESIPIKSIYANNRSLINPIFDTIRFFNLISKSIFSK